MKDNIFNMLNNLTNKDHIKIVSRGNKAILYALKIAKKLGKTKVLIQDQGGWITYRQYPQRLKLELVEVKTDFGLIDLKDLEKKADENSILLLNSMPGYAALEDISDIYNVCIRKKIFLINDVTGSIGTEAAKKGDIVFCSFGKAKPIDYGQGAFIATNNDELLNLIRINEEDFDIEEKLKTLDKRLEFLNKKRKQIIKGLKGLPIIHKNKKGINVIVKTKYQAEKDLVESYCKDNDLEYTICPRYIRVQTDAISIEVKRLTFKN